MLRSLLLVELQVKQVYLETFFKPWHLKWSLLKTKMTYLSQASSIVNLLQSLASQCEYSQSQGHLISLPAVSLSLWYSATHATYTLLFHLYLSSKTCWSYCYNLNELFASTRYELVTTKNLHFILSCILFSLVLWHHLDWMTSAVSSGYTFLIMHSSCGCSCCCLHCSS